MAITYEVVEQSAREVLETSAGARVLGARPGEEDSALTEVVGTLSFVGALGGTLVIHCSLAQANSITNAMLGESGEPDVETVRDAMGEVLNQVGGTIKRKIAANGTDFMLSPPVVVTGNPPLSHGVKTNSTPVCTELTLEEGKLSVSLWPAN